SLSAFRTEDWRYDWRYQVTFGVTNLSVARTAKPDQRRRAGIRMRPSHLKCCFQGGPRDGAEADWRFAMPGRLAATWLRSSGGAYRGGCLDHGAFRQGQNPGRAIAAIPRFVLEWRSPGPGHYPLALVATLRVNSPALGRCCASPRGRTLVGSFARLQKAE